MIGPVVGARHALDGGDRDSWGCFGALGGQAGVLFVEIRPRHDAPAPATLAEGAGANQLQDRQTLSTNASMDQPHRTSLTNSADRLTSKDVAVFTPCRHHRWLCTELGCQPSATGLFRLLPLVSGMICHSTSRLQNLCLSSAVASRLISLGAAFCDTLTVVVPEKWLCHSGHVNRFCLLVS